MLFFSFYICEVNERCPLIEIHVVAAAAAAAVVVVIAAATAAQQLLLSLAVVLRLFFRSSLFRIRFVCAVNTDIRFTRIVYLQQVRLLRTVFYVYIR